MSKMYVTVARTFFVLLMLASSIGKLLDMPGFYSIVRTYQMMPEWFVIPSAWGLTLFELFLGLALLSRAWFRWVWLLLPLHLFYLLGLSQALLRGLNIPNCGCFGVYWGRPLTPYTLVEDLILLALAFLLFKLSPKDR